MEGLADWWLISDELQLRTANLRSQIRCMPCPLRRRINHLMIKNLRHHPQVTLMRLFNDLRYSFGMKWQLLVHTLLNSHLIHN